MSFFLHCQRFKEKAFFLPPSLSNVARNVLLDEMNLSMSLLKSVTDLHFAQDVMSFHALPQLPKAFESDFDIVSHEVLCYITCKSVKVLLPDCSMVEPATSDDQDEEIEEGASIFWLSPFYSNCINTLLKSKECNIEDIKANMSIGQIRGILGFNKTAYPIKFRGNKNSLARILQHEVTDIGKLVSVIHYERPLTRLTRSMTSRAHALNANDGEGSGAARGRAVTRPTPSENLPPTPRGRGKNKAREPHHRVRCPSCKELFRKSYLKKDHPKFCKGGLGVKN